MVRILQSSWVTALVGCLLYLGVTAALITPSKLPVIQPLAESGTSSGHAGSDVPSWRFRNPEFDQWLQEVKREKESLAIREQQLRELQSRLEVERQELNTVTQSIHLMQLEFDKSIVRIKEQEMDNLKRQAKLLSGMSPEGAANLLNQMPEAESVRILYTMKADEASAILDTLSKMGKIEAKRAAYITEQMRHTLPPDAPGRTKASL